MELARVADINSTLCDEPGRIVRPLGGGASTDVYGKGRSAQGTLRIG